MAINNFHNVTKVLYWLTRARLIRGWSSTKGTCWSSQPCPIKCIWGILSIAIKATVKACSRSITRRGSTRTAASRERNFVHSKITVSIGTSANSWKKQVGSWCQSAGTWREILMPVQVSDNKPIQKVTLRLLSENSQSISLQTICRRPMVSSMLTEAGCWHWFQRIIARNQQSHVILHVGDENDDARSIINGKSVWGAITPVP